MNDDRDRHLQDLNRLRQELQRLDEDLAQRQAQLSWEGERLLASKADWASARAQLSDRIAQERQLAAARQASLDTLLASTSWRLLAPVRYLVTMARRLGRFGTRPSSGISEVQPPVLESATGDVPATADARASDWRVAAFRTYQRQLAVEWAPLLQQRARAMSAGPVISVLVPIFDTPETILREMLASVIGQYYGRWELCLCDDASPAAHVRRIIAEFADRDDRIKVLHLPENRGVSYATNRALEMASADFVVLLDHDDLLEPQALLRVAETIVADDPDIVYSDEVVVEADGQTANWYLFRPAFSPTYLRAHPYIVHLVAYRWRLLVDIGGVDEELSISQDYDLMLRASEKAQRIVHLPEILYRWRLRADSVGHQRIHRVSEVSLDALRRHAQRSGVDARIGLGKSFNFYDFRVQTGPARVAIVIPSKNQAALVRQCIDSIVRTAGDVDYEIVLIDHQSDDPLALQYFASLTGRVRCLRYEGPFNFSAINNWAVAQLSDPFDYLLFCNNDIEALDNGWLARMLAIGQQPGVGIVGAKLYYPDHRTLQHAGVCVGAFSVAENLGRAMHAPPECLETGYIGSLIATRELSAVTAACMLVKKSVFAEIRGFDENLEVLFGDVDICLRAIAHGYRVVFCAEAELLHHEAASRGQSGELGRSDGGVFMARWADYLAHGDPYFNPNLSLSSALWEIKRPLMLVPGLQRRVYISPLDRRQCRIEVRS